MQNIYFPMRILLPLALIWIVLLFQLNWSSLNLNRLIFLSFIALFLSFFPAVYVPIESYQEGLKYFKDYHFSTWGTPGIPSSGLLIVLGVAFLGFSILRLKKQIHQDFNRKLKNNELSNRQQMYGSLLLITHSAILGLIALFVGSLFSAFPFSLLFMGLINSETGGYIPALFVGMLMIILATGATIPQKAVMFLLLLVHLSSLWIYAQSLPLKEQSSFPQGFAEAVKKDVDIKAIHQWMASQNCSSASDPSFEIHTESMDYMGTDGARDREKFKQLPAAIRKTKPIDINFYCERDKDESRLTLYFLPRDSWKLTFVYPPVSDKALLEDRHQTFGYTIIDDCSCYID